MQEYYKLLPRFNFFQAGPEVGQVPEDRQPDGHHHRPVQPGLSVYKLFFFFAYQEAK
jgi:hypothetical protein